MKYPMRGQRLYANIAIETALTLRRIFHLPLRQTEGFLRSLADLLEVDLPIPDHTTLSRRLKKLGEIGFHRLATDRPIHLLIDSTGFRIHVGHLRKPPKRRAWRKLHLAVDADTGKIVASDMTGRRTHDYARVPALLEQIDNRVAAILADGAYDALGVYEAAQKKRKRRVVRVLIPPGRNAHLAQRPTAALEEKNRNIRSIRELGRREWHKQSGYSKRAMVEKGKGIIRTLRAPEAPGRMWSGGTGGVKNGMRRIILAAADRGGGFRSAPPVGPTGLRGQAPRL